ncbi:MAG TPA: hypothetical protein VM260_02690, partial [Pirellula sp.]|nr:hypothetical protein [Pirellula sp.]
MKIRSINSFEAVRGIAHFASLSLRTGQLFSGLGVFISVFLLLAFCIAASASDPLPANRKLGGIGWAGLVGVPGGIPNRSTIYATFSPGATTADIQNALNNCPSNQVVFLNAGTYNLTQLTMGRNGVTLRGATNQWGQPATVINSSGHGLLIGSCCNWYGAFGAPSSANTKAWTSGFAQGTTSIQVANTTGLSPGMLVYLDQYNDVDTTAYSP